MCQKYEKGNKHHPHHPLSVEQVQFIHDVCKDCNYSEIELVTILHRVQKKLGYLPEEVQEVIADCIKVPLSRVYGVVSFYSFFTMEPSGKYPISICTGTACYVRGADHVLEKFEDELGIKVGETTDGGLFSIDTLRCVGTCGLAPVAKVGDKIYGHVTVEMVPRIIREFRELDALQNQE